MARFIQSWNVRFSNGCHNIGHFFRQNDSKTELFHGISEIISGSWESGIRIFTDIKRTVAIWIPKTQNLNIRLFGHFFVRCSNGLITWLGGPFQNRPSQTIKQTFLIWFSGHHSKTGPFNNRTCLDHLNTGLIWYSDGYCKCGNKLKQEPVGWSDVIPRPTNFGILDEHCGGTDTWDGQLSDTCDGQLPDTWALEVSDTRAGGVSFSSSKLVNNSWVMSFCCSFLLHASMALEMGMLTSTAWT